MKTEFLLLSLLIGSGTLSFADGFSPEDFAEVERQEQQRNLGYVREWKRWVKVEKDDEFHRIELSSELSYQGLKKLISDKVCYGLTPDFSVKMREFTLDLDSVYKINLYEIVKFGESSDGHLRVVTK